MDNGLEAMLSLHVEFTCIENQIHVKDTFGYLTLSQITDLPEIMNQLMDADFDIRNI
jgi:hypothetical protein